MAEEASGAIPGPVSPAYVWGDLLPVLAAREPDLRIANLETSVTRSDRLEDKGIDYCMHPAQCRRAEVGPVRRVRSCNNLVLDWGREGLFETFQTLYQAGIGHVGSGEDHHAAAAPLRLERERRAIATLAFALPDSGVPGSWSAAPGRSGAVLLNPDPENAVAVVAGPAKAIDLVPDAVFVTVHGGADWGCEVPAAHRAFAHGLIDEAGADIVQGHSWHHPKAIEFHRGRPIFCGCVDLLNEYEGIGGHKRFRADLVIGYLVDVDPGSGTCVDLEMLPFALRRFRLERAD